MSMAAKARSQGLPPATIYLGTDTEGHDHVYRSSTHAVHVVGPDGAREHVARLGDRTVDDWMAFIDEEYTGWDHQHYGVDFVDMLREGLHG